jgi:hypothetical protein
VPVTTAAKETGSDGPHEKISAQLNITEAGYVYAYLSNDNTTPIEVYFDDFSVTHEQNSVVAQLEKQLGFIFSHTPCWFCNHGGKHPSC